MNNNTIWIKDLDELVEEYNNNYHRSIKMKPIDASKNQMKILLKIICIISKIQIKNRNFQLVIK